ncbi:tandem-95 repeat protein, partial [Lutimaribacter marinistellae]
PADFNGAVNVEVIASDGTESVSSTFELTIDPVNDASEIDVSAQTPTVHVEAVDTAPAVPTFVADKVDVIDVDGLDYDSGSFSASVVGGDVNDVLDLAASGVVTVSGGGVSVNGTQVGFVSGLGSANLSVLFTTAAQAADVEAVVQALTYATTDDTPPASREISLNLSDGDGASGVQKTVTVTIDDQNDTPTPVDDTFGASEGSFVSTINLLTRGTPDSDPEGDTLTVVNISDVADGSEPAGDSSAVSASAGVVTTDWGAEVTLQQNGQLFYNLTSSTARFNELKAGETATDSFTYAVSDGNGGSATATVQVEIAGTNDAIIANGDAIMATEDTVASVTGNILDNDTDVDVNDTRSIVNVTNSATASAIAVIGGYQITTVDGVVIQLATDGSYSLTAPDSLADGQTYTASFQYTVQDGGSSSSVATVIVAVTGDNDAPDAAAVTLIASDEDQVRIITEAELLAGASDPDANASLSITDLTLTSGNGQLVDNFDGTWTYTPELNDDSSVSFSYTVSDGSLIATGSAGLDLLPVNDAPVVDAALADQSSDEDTAFSFTVPAGTFSDV